MKNIFILLFSISSLFSEVIYQDDIDAEDSFELFEEGAIIIDVRTPSEFIHTGHGLGHINIPVLYEIYKPKALKIVSNFAKMEIKKGAGLNSKKIYTKKVLDNPDFFKNIMSLTKGNLEKDLVIICHSGQRSKYAANILAKKGFENVYNLDGGFLAWKDAKYPWSVD